VSARARKSCAWLGPGPGQSGTSIKYTTHARLVTEEHNKQVEYVKRAWRRGSLWKKRSATSRLEYTNDFFCGALAALDGSTMVQRSPRIKKLPSAWLAPIPMKPNMEWARKRGIDRPSTNSKEDVMYILGSVCYYPRPGGCAASKTERLWRAGKKTLHAQKHDSIPNRYQILLKGGHHRQDLDYACFSRSRPQGWTASDDGSADYPIPGRCSPIHDHIA